MIDKFPRLVTPSTPPYNSLELVKTLQSIVCRLSDTARKYTNVYIAGVYGGIATAYAVGCPLRCIFCWVDDSREYPEKRGRFYTPGALVDTLIQSSKRKGIKKARISGAEPTLCKEHLLQVLPLVEDSPFEVFMLETNGILFGADAGYVQNIAPFNKVHVRVSLKAATPEGFQQRTGALGEHYLLPFQAIEYLKEADVSFHVAAMTDSRLMSPDERKLLIKKLNGIDPKLAANLEEEVCDPYPSTLSRLDAAGLDVQAFFKNPS